MGWKRLNIKPKARGRHETPGTNDRGTSEMMPNTEWAPWHHGGPIRTCKEEGPHLTRCSPLSTRLSFREKEKEKGSQWPVCVT